jgi:hypothetical protein
MWSGIVRLSRIVCVALLCLSASQARLLRADEPEIFFEKKVRPLLVAKCLECHGPDEPEAGLKLTSREEVLKGGDSGPAAKAHAAQESLLMKVVRRKGPIKMPPDETLPAAEIEVLEQWIAMGMPWPGTGGQAVAKKEFSVSEADRTHWSFRPLADPVPPTVRNEVWPRTTIDRFVLAKLEAAGIRPAPESDRRTLLRRATYDLIGLPPSWDETQSFVNDPASTDEAFRKVVDRLLASPLYGERWGRHWLDVARFADSKDGVLMYGDDRIRPYAYTYRDYVIRAFNEDTPFDRFIREQIAADRIRPAVEPWRMAALGFLTLGRMYDNNVHDIIDDQIDTVSRGFLGLTVACARCHDHKYDPLSTADYYSLYGVFASSEAPLELPLTVTAISKEAEEFEKQARAKREAIRKFRDEQFATLSETARRRVGDYLEMVAVTKPDPMESAIFFLSLAPEDLRPPIVARWRKFVDRRAKPDDPVFGIWHDLMRLQIGEESASAESASSETFAAKAKSVLNQWQTKPVGIDAGQINPLVLESFVKANLTNKKDVARTYGELFLRAYDATKPRSGEASQKPMLSAAETQILDVLTSRESPAYFPMSQTRRYMSRAETDKFGGMVQELDRMAVKSPHAPPRAMALTDTESPYEPHIFVRGNPTSPGRRVPRQFLELLSPGGQKPFGDGSGRMDLADAIASADNPLTARVIVNRVWMLHFGEPLVASPSDFGKRVAEPTHAALLDHLAAKFVRDGWSIKKLHRHIMHSSVYRQGSKPYSPSDSDTDPENRLLSRANRQRLSFEAMRDTLLAVSGRLALRAGGLPIDATDPKSTVRTVYGLVDRQSLPGVFRAFDFAIPDQTVERRVRTMGPQQALFALNSPFVVEQAKALAARPEANATNDPVLRIQAMYRIVLQRDPTPEERAAAVDFVGMAKDEASQMTPWEQLAQVLLSSNELMYVD